MSESNSEEDPYAIQAVDPSWFESPAEGLSTSGGTAAFFKLKLTEEGLKGVKARELPSFKNRTIDETYWIGKDLSHASDEKDFYLQVLQIRNEYQEDQKTQESKDLTEGIGLVEAFMFDYLGVLSTKTTESDDTVHLLVMRNMRNKYQHFRMLDLKIGEKTAQAGWKGKSRMRAMKHHLMDGLSNSAAEGYRLAGFNGCPEVFDSMDPLMDIMSTESLDDSNKDFNKEDESETVGWKTLWGKKIDNSKHAQAKRFMLNSLDGTGVFRYFYDLHMDGNPNDNPTDKYLPIEVAEIVSHELTKQLVELAAACHKVKIPQKWIGSSVAVCFDAGYFPDRNDELDLEQQIRSKVLCKIFDWGRSELLPAKEFDAMTTEQQTDRQHFWDLYKKGIDRMSYNATRFYYHQFTKTTLYSDITIRCYDFDSMSADDYIGKVVIPLPDPTDASGMTALDGSKDYKLKGMVASAYGSTITCSIEWEDFPESSRLKGVWKVTVQKATNLPPLDGIHLGTSDPYCMVMGNSTQEDGQHFIQRTCVKTRTLNPEWNETISVPVARETGLESLMDLTSSTKHELSDRLKWDKHWSFSATNKEDANWWLKVLDGGEE